MVWVQAFLNVATGGFGTEVTVQTDEDLKSKMGGAAYLFTGACRPSEVPAMQLHCPMTRMTPRAGIMPQLTVETVDCCAAV